jgi:hypothetical protein
MAEPRLLTDALLSRFESALRDRGIRVDDLRPGLTDQEIDTLTEPGGFVLPDEVRRWWHWHNGYPRGAGPSLLLPNRAMLSLEESVGRRLAVPGVPDQNVPGLLPIEGPPYYILQCTHSGPVASPVWIVLDWAGGIEGTAPSLGELVATWTDHLERGVWLPDPDGGWAEIQPALENGLPADVEVHGIW